MLSKLKSKIQEREDKFIKIPSVSQSQLDKLTGFAHKWRDSCSTYHRVRWKKKKKEKFLNGALGNWSFPVKTPNGNPLVLFQQTWEIAASLHKIQLDPELSKYNNGRRRSGHFSLQSNRFELPITGSTGKGEREKRGRGVLGHRSTR